VKLVTSFPVALKYHLTEDETGRDGKTMGKTWENLENRGKPWKKPWKMLFDVKIMGNSTK
jgi:hypothetical protein